MSRSTIERAFELARSGEVQNLVALKARLKAEGCRAVDALLAPRNIASYLEAICTAACKTPQAMAAAD
ncbi:hypothetical protein [Phenylobacterium sp.]|jgi:hypothetical protein|uniref:hypothetical protein n=1 Tax=Phenylobacterium sp. TaxID=1871053 RepID=UPI002F948B2D